jgi:hypothetical protein
VRYKWRARAKGQGHGDGVEQDWSMAKRRICMQQTGTSTKSGVSGWSDRAQDISSNSSASYVGLTASTIGPSLTLFSRRPVPRGRSGGRDLSSCVAAKLIHHSCRLYEAKELAFVPIKVYIRPAVLPESFSTISITSYTLQPHQHSSQPPETSSIISPCLTTPAPESTRSYPDMLRI